jgi:hypothetical protein
MSEQLSLGITVQNNCYECMVIARDMQEGLPVGKCQSCLEQEEANADRNAWNLHEDDRLGEGPGMSYDTSDAPSASDWVSSQTYVRPQGWVVKMTEIWDDNCHLVEMSVQFLEHDEPVIRHEFLPPIAQLIDGGEFEELWELDDMMQAQRETECKWCHIMTPKLFNDCQSCDQPLELNVR